MYFRVFYSLKFVRGVALLSYTALASVFLID